MKNNDMMYTSKKNIITYLLSILLPSSLLNSFPSPFKRNKYLEFQKFIILLVLFTDFHVCIKIAYYLSFVFWTMNTIHTLCILLWLASFKHKNILTICIYTVQCGCKFTQSHCCKGISSCDYITTVPPFYYW